MGACSTLVNELKIEEAQQYVNFVRMSASQVETIKAGVHLSAESEINVESWVLSSVHTPESALRESWDLCQRASPTVVDTVHPDV